VLAALAGAVALVCALFFGGGGGDKQNTASSVGTPAQSITPGPTSGHGATGSNDGTVGGDGSGGASPSAGASGAPTAAPSGGPVVTGPSGSSAGSGSGGSGSGGSGSVGTEASNQSDTMSLPICSAADLDLSLTSTEQIYAASQLPSFRLDITNTGGGACRIDLGAKSAVLTITSDTGAQVWSSGDCPKSTASQWYAVPAAGSGPLSATFAWGRTTSTPGCIPGSGGSAAPAGTYVAHIDIGGLPAQPQHQFKLAPFGS
jgi:hypothetical protein